MLVERTDIHRPSAIVPSDYEYVGIWTMKIEGLGDAEFMLQERKVCREHMARTGGHTVHYSNGSCGICGNVQAIYLVLFYHAKSNEYIVVGCDCARKLEMSFDSEHMNFFKKNVADAREAQAGKRKAIALLSDAGLIDAWEIFTAEFPKHTADCKVQYVDERNARYIGEPVEGSCTCDLKARRAAHDLWEERTIRDIVGKLVRYGSISEKQRDFVRSLLGKIARRPIIEAQRKAEHDAAADVVAGRRTVTGTVLSLKEVEGAQYSYYSPETVWKVLVKLSDGSKVWGSRFANINRGDSVRFTATFEQSKDDPKFGFFKRPVLAKSDEEIAAAKAAKKQAAADKKFLSTVAWG